MSTSSNQNIQKLMNEVDSLDPNDSSLEAKLNLIAQKVAVEQGKVSGKLTAAVDDSNLIDPSDAFACEGCQ